MTETLLQAQLALSTKAAPANDATDRRVHLGIQENKAGGLRLSGSGVRPVASLDGSQTGNRADNALSREAV